MGAILTIGGIVGFSYAAPPGSEMMFGLVAADALHNAVHIATGLLALTLLFRRPRVFAVGLGSLYLLLAGWGVLLGSAAHPILGFIAVSAGDNAQRLLLGALGVVAGAWPRAAHAHLPVSSPIPVTEMSRSNRA